jgi:hypothetical protein
MDNAELVEPVFSTNDRAERVMGRRVSPDDEHVVIPFDSPCELGFWCPVCRVPPLVDGEYDERLHWSEYRGFLWCEVCDRDYPSALCVPLDAAKDPERPWWNAGPDDAIEVFLSTVENVVALAVKAQLDNANADGPAGGFDGRR